MKKIERLLPAIEWLKNEWEARVADHIVIDNVPSTLDEKRKIYFTLEDNEDIDFETELWSAKASDIVTATVLSYEKHMRTSTEETLDFFSDEPKWGFPSELALKISFDAPDDEDDEDYN